MTDAERIAEYMLRAHGQTWDAHAIKAMLGDDASFAPGSYYDRVRRIADMLSDVRREERKAWETILDEEIDASVAKGELIASSRLARIKICMKARGDK